MSPLCQRILCDLLFGIECFSCPFEHAQEDAETNEDTEWPPRLHNIHSIGVYESQYLPVFQDLQKPAWNVRAAGRTCQIHALKLPNGNASRVKSIFTVDTFYACAILL